MKNAVRFAAALFAVVSLILMSMAHSACVVVGGSCG